ncbi:MAG: alpha/beta fold hydrolase [Thermonemataceae bacterium]
MQHKTLSTPDGTIHYWRSAPKASCILFTHGALMDHGLFQSQVDFFAEKYTVIAWDVPAHGQSRPFGKFTLQKAANALIHILDTEKVTKVHLVGQSMGGYIAQIAAREVPERILSLTAVGSSPIQPQYYSKLDMWLLSITPFLLRLYPYNYLIKTIAKQVSTTKAGQSYALETLKKLSKPEIVNIMRGVYEGVKAYSQNNTLPIPVLITLGDLDKSGKVATYCEAWAAKENRPLQVINNAAHNANMDNAVAFNEILDEFLSTIK